MDQQDSIKVGIRVRPLLEREKESGSSWVVSGNTIREKASTSPGYYFDYIFDETVDTASVFKTLVRPIVLSVMQGFNGTIFAYGQTSSGKTHTMMGNDEPGVIPNTLFTIFDFIDTHANREFIIRVSYLEIYNEGLTDLLNPINKDLKIREDTQRNVRVHGLTEQAVLNLEDIAHWLSVGENNRSVGKTNMNEHSSRSHTIFTLAIESRERDEAEGDGAVKVSTLNLVDLAGSERVSATGAEGIRFKEGTFINLSLLTLGNVISKLSDGYGDKGGHIPFRDSRLTRILQPSLGGNAKTCIICAVTPAEIGETHSTLKFASRAQTIKNKPVMNEVVLGEEALLKKLNIYEKENERLKRLLAESGSGLPEQDRQKLSEQLAEKEKQKMDLQTRIKSLEEMIVKSSTITESTTTAKAARRQTVCPGYLARDIRPHPELKPLKTVRTPRRVTFASSPMVSPAFQPYFNRSSFEQHLDEISPVVLPDSETVVRHRSRLIGRPSFLPRGSTSCDFIDEESATSESMVRSIQVPPTILVDAQVQTEPPLQAPLLSTATGLGISMQDAACQADLKLQRDLREGPSLDHSLCGHRFELMGTREQLETLQLEVDEKDINLQSLRESLESAEQTAKENEATAKNMESEKERLQKKLKDFEMASQAQEELLLELQGRLKETTGRLHQAQERGNQVEAELASAQSAEEEVSSLKVQLEERMAEMTSQEHTIVSLTHQLQEKSEAAVASDHVSSSLRSQLAEASSRLEQRAAQIASQEQIIRDLTQQLQETSEAAAVASDHASASLRSQLAEASSRLEQMAAQATSKELTINELTHQLQEKSDAVVAGDHTLMSLRTQLAETNSQLEQRAAQISDLTHQLQEKPDATPANDHTSLREQLDEANSMLEERIAANLDQEQAICDLNRELAAATRTVEAHSQERKKVAMEMGALKEQLVALQLQLQRKSSSSSSQSSRPAPEVATASAPSNQSRELKELQTKVSELEQLRREDAERFQCSYEQKVMETKKAWERVSLLQEHLETLQDAPQDDQISELQAALELKTQAVQDLTDKHMAAEEHAHKVWTEYKEHVAQTDSAIRELQQQLTIAEEEKGVALLAQERCIAELRQQLQAARELEKRASPEPETVARLTAEVQEARAALEAKATVTTSLEQMVAQLQRQLEGSEAEVEIKAAANRTLEQALAEQKEQLENSAVARQAKAAAVDSLEQEVAELKIRLGNSEATLQAEVAQLKRQLESSEAEIQAKTAASDSLVSKLNGQLESVQAELQAKAAAGASLEKALAQLQERSRSTETKLQAKTAACVSLELTLTQLQERLDKTEAELQAKVSASASLEQELTHMKGNLGSTETRLQAQSTSLQHEVSQLQDQLCNVEAQLMEKSSALEQQEKATAEIRSQARTALKEKDEALQIQERVAADASNQLQQARASLQEQTIELSEKSSRLEKELAEGAELKTMFEEYYTQFSDLQFSEQELENKCADLEQVNEQLTTKLQKSEDSYCQRISELTRKVQELEQQGGRTTEIEQQLCDFRKENARLQSKIQGQAAVLSGTSASGVVNNGPDFATSMAYYELKSDNTHLKREVQQLKIKLQKLREEFHQQRERFDKEREDCKRYRQERSIFRAKYEDLKLKHNVISASKKEPESSQPAQKASSPLPLPNYSATQEPLAKLPSPRPARKSLLSLRPERNLTRPVPAPQQPPRPGVPLLKPLRAPRQTALLEVDGTGNDEVENFDSQLQATSQKKFVWEQTMLEMNAGKEGKRDNQDKCETQ